MSRSNLAQWKARRQPCLVPAAQGTIRGRFPIARNEPCPCKSGKKFKRCHGAPPAPEVGKTSPVEDAGTHRAVAPQILNLDPCREPQAQDLSIEEAMSHGGLRLIPEDPPPEPIDTLGPSPMDTNNPAGFHPNRII